MWFAAEFGADDAAAAARTALLPDVQRFTLLLLLAKAREVTGLHFTCFLVREGSLQWRLAASISHLSVPVVGQREGLYRVDFVLLFVLQKFIFFWLFFAPGKLLFSFRLEMHWPK